MDLRSPGVMISLVRLARSWVMSGTSSGLAPIAGSGVEKDESPEVLSLLGVVMA
jgi:hypothetical protein